MPYTSSEASQNAPALEAASPGPRGSAVRVWLILLCAMIVVMVLLGGATRLTGSGLSMTEWQPLTVLPPLSADAWNDSFAAYRASPEYAHKTFGMTLEEFKGIFWLEFIHRNWGRLIGLAVALPLAWFAWRGEIDRPLAWRMAGLFVLGGLQGALGWFMVKSGLQDRPEVSQYRLAAHLGLAVLLYAALLWTTLTLTSRGRPLSTVGRRALGLAGLVFLTMLSGAFVAGLDAGLVYNTFPLMDGRLVPQGWGLLAPWWLNLFENVTAVQFNHRLLGLTTVAASVALWLWARRLRLPPAAQKGLIAIIFSSLLQLGLGLATLLLAVPTGLAVAHQGGALLLLSVALWVAAGTRGE